MAVDKSAWIEAWFDVFSNDINQACHFLFSEK